MWSETSLLRDGGPLGRAKLYRGAKENWMTITLNHTIVFVRDKKASSMFLTVLVGLPPAKPFGPFLAVQVGEVTLDYDEVDDPAMGHYAFLVSEAEFDTIFNRIRERKLPY